MESASDSALVLFPGALGDFLCFLPTLLAVRRKHAGRLCLVVQAALLDLVRLANTTTLSIARREIAELFSARAAVSAEAAALFSGFAHVYSWTGFGDAQLAQHLTQLSGGRLEMHRFRNLPPTEHAVDYYARCVGLSPAFVDASMIVEDSAWATAFMARHGLAAHGFLLMHPGSGARAKNWEGFDAVAQQWHQRYRGAIVVLRGPAEVERLIPPITDAIALETPSLSQAAALLRRCRVYLGNDSGISHLAGVVGTRGVILFGATDPAVWAPRSSHLTILHAPHPCAPCGSERFCTHRLAPEAVIAALGRAVSAEP